MELMTAAFVNGPFEMLEDVTSPVKDQASLSGSGGLEIHTCLRGNLTVSDAFSLCAQRLE